MTFWQRVASRCMSLFAGGADVRVEAAIELLGEPGGDGVWLLREELTRACDEARFVRAAWLSRIRIAGADAVGVAVVLDVSEWPLGTVRRFSAAYQDRGLPPLDILLRADLDGRAVRVLGDLTPFYPV